MAWRNQKTAFQLLIAHCQISKGKRILRESYLGKNPWERESVSHRLCLSGAPYLTLPHLSVWERYECASVWLKPRESEPPVVKGNLQAVSLLRQPDAVFRNSDHCPEVPERNLGCNLFSPLMWSDASGICEESVNHHFTMYVCIKISHGTL